MYVVEKIVFLSKILFRDKNVRFLLFFFRIARGYGLITSKHRLIGNMFTKCVYRLNKKVCPFWTLKKKYRWEKTNLASDESFVRRRSQTLNKKSKRKKICFLKEIFYWYSLSHFTSIWSL